MIGNFDENIQIARWSAAHSGLAFARKTDTRASFDAARDVDGQRLFLFDPARAVADVAGVLDRLTRAITGWAGPFDGEKALLRAHFTHARTGRTNHWFGPVVGTHSIAVAALYGGGHVDRLGQPGKGLFKLDP